MIYENYPYLNTFLEIQMKRFQEGIVVDIGARNGANCILLSSKFKKFTIHAIEPSPSNFKVMKRKVKNYQNVKIHRVAISNKNGEEDFHIIYLKKRDLLSESDSLYCDFVKSKSQGMRNIKVPALTLNTFCKQQNINHINLLSMNCEGGEYKIFEDKSSLWIFDNVSVISWKLHGKIPLFLSKKYIGMKKWINAFLHDKGFQIIYGERLDLMDRIPSNHIQQVWVKE